MLYIFDMGGVVLHGVFELQTILAEQGKQTDTLAHYRDGLMADLSAGAIDEDEYWSRFNERYGTAVVSPRWGKTFEPELDGEMVAFIAELKKSHRVVCGTNTFEAHWKRSVDRGDYDIFHRTYASHRMGTAKPYPAFWETIMREEGYGPEETVFIDDFQENAEAASQLGIRSLLFRNLPSLRKALAL